MGHSEAMMDYNKRDFNVFQFGVSEEVKMSEKENDYKTDLVTTAEDLTVLKNHFTT